MRQCCKEYLGIGLYLGVDLAERTISGKPELNSEVCGALQILAAC